MVETVWKIYKTTCLVNGKVYIGQTIKEGYELRRYFGSGNLIRNAINKYKKVNFRKEILMRCNSQEMSDEYEALFIELYSSTNKDIGYNYFSSARHDLRRARQKEVDKKGGNGFWFGKTFSEEHRRNMSIGSMGTGKDKIITEAQRKAISERVKGENHPFYGKFGAEHPSFGKKISAEGRKNISDGHKGEKNYMFGKKHTEETKKKLREAHTGMKASEETKLKQSAQRKGHLNSRARAVEVCDLLTGDVVLKFRTVQECAIWLGFKKKEIFKRLQRKCKQYNLRYAS
jgi:hypothetical protein